MDDVGEILVGECHGTVILFDKSAEHEIPHHQSYSDTHPHGRTGDRQGLFGGRGLYVGLDGGMLGHTRSVQRGDIDGIGTLHAGLLIGGGCALSPTPVQDDATRAICSIHWVMDTPSVRMAVVVSRSVCVVVRSVVSVCVATRREAPHESRHNSTTDKKNSKRPLNILFKSR